jgi:hypothetical protein
MRHLTRRHLISRAAALSAAPTLALAQSLEGEGDPNQAQAAPEIRALWSVASGTGREYQVGLGYFLEAGTRQSIPGLILALRYSEQPTDLLNEVLRKLAGVSPSSAPSDWFGWMVWQQQATDLTPNAAYAPFKRALLLSIDPNFETFLQPQFLQPAAMRIRLEEVTWGGVAMDGLVPLDSPRMVPAREAEYLGTDDLVFGVSIQGDTRAYPLRILGWHEMLNDLVGGLPVALTYCPLCGAGQLYQSGANAERRFVFGSSGLLHRSNKLMFDRQTYSLWSQFAGTPVMGPLGLANIQLPRLPMVTSRWGDWRAANPETSVLSIETGSLRAYGAGAAYRGYDSSPDLMFPAAVQDPSLPAK